MEASRKQLPIDPAEPQDGTVRVLEDRIVIEGLTISDGETARVVRDRAETGEEPARTVRRTIEIGARVLDREESGVEVDYVRREFERVTAEHQRQAEAQSRAMTERVEKELHRAFGVEGGRGTLAEALESHARELTDLVDETFGDGSEDNVKRRIEELIESRNRNFLERLMSDDERNPLRPLLNQFAKWTQERKEAHDARDEKLEAKLDEFLQQAAELIGLDLAREAVAEAEEAGTRKGFAFEDVVHAELEQIADRRGDAARHVGGERNEAGSKKGDTLVEIGAADGAPAARVVFEAKDKKLSRNDAWRELDRAMGERGAEFAVLVVSTEEKVPARTERVQEYQGNKMIAVLDKEAVDPLELALVYRYARARALLAGEGELEVDAAGVRDAMEQAAAALKRAKGVRDCFTAAEQGVNRARDGFNEIVADVDACLARIESLIAPAAD